MTTQKGLILIVDDIAENRQVLGTTLKKHTDYNIMMAADGQTMLKAVKKRLPDLILLDIMMPGMDGYEAALILKNDDNYKHIPIIFITAMDNVEDKVKAFQNGGIDYITKPFNNKELLARVNAQMNLKIMQDKLKEKNRLLADREVHLTHLVQEKTGKIEKTTLALVSALEDANLFNDNDTGNHIKRVSEYSALFAEQYGCNSDFVKRIKLYASLHDVGKVAIPDNILKKPGKYTEEEFEQMKAHVGMGGRMLDNPEIDRMAHNIALYHHEKWDGQGYIHSLQKTDIPLEARLTALADVYDALVNKRVYKPAFSEEKADAIIRESSGSHFEPRIVDIYFDNKQKILEIKNELK